MSRRWLKLDTGVVQHFDRALGALSDTVQTGTGATLRALHGTQGWRGVLVALCCAIRDPAHDLVAGNLTRKQIRLPAVFGNRVIGGAYGWLKAVEARLLEYRLAAQLSDDPDRAALIYNGSLFPESVLASVADRLNRERLFIEAGFFPGTLQIDPRGLNAANSVPRDPAFYLNSDTDFAAPGLPDLLNQRATKAKGPDPITLPESYIFVAFQVPSDMQVTLHSPWVRDMHQFYNVIRDAAERQPDRVFVIKEHPSFPLSVQGDITPHPRVIFANTNVTRDLILGAQAVITLNSTVGLEAVLMDRPVIILADACYDIDGLVLRARNAQDLDHAIKRTTDWMPDAALRRQVLGWLWNHYLVHARYDDLPSDLGDRLDRQLNRSDL
ncbi:capsular polysaccharide export protein [Loktanella sp. DSM 29012]|uniref:capsular polysaccharide export protein, LipB/KpsS family n=1 Tax=Loktanella sp. DSM 29012 TaxID=1881056 RepID=UPI0008D58559|nr:nitrogen fixation protein FixF [Loktanella sp. DSM 29012]SEP64166.1 capsular polysaccharide export protein [Loktanella sp. DSM 29012]